MRVLAGSVNVPETYRAYLSPVSSRSLRSIPGKERLRLFAVAALLSVILPFEILSTPLYYGNKGAGWMGLLVSPYCSLPANLVFALLLRALPTLSSFRLVLNVLLGLALFWLVVLLTASVFRRFYFVPVVALFWMGGALVLTALYTLTWEGIYLLRRYYGRKKPPDTI